jgi:DNA-binding transcriptional ArsR family regulator
MTAAGDGPAEDGGPDDDLVFAALADATRRALLDRLFAAPGLTLGELVAGLGMRRQSATRHLKVLERANLVAVRWQGREKHHYLNPLPIAAIERRWIDKFAGPKARALATLKAHVETEPGGEPS